MKPEPLIVSPVPELIVIPSPVVAEIASFEPETLRFEPAPIDTELFDPVRATFELA